MLAKLTSIFDGASPLKKVFLALIVAMVLAIIVEVIGLIILASQVPRYRNYWQTYNQTTTGEITYVALGDSAAQGIGATSPQRSYVGLIAKRIEQATGKTVKLINLSKTGATLADGLDHQLPQLENYQPDIVTVELGANNVKTLDPEKFRREFKQMLELLPSGSFVADMPDFGERSPHLTKQRQAAQIAREELAKFPQLNPVRLDEYTQEHFNHIFDYAPDFFHPNNSGYRVWADAYWRVMQETLEDTY